MHKLVINGGPKTCSDPFPKYPIIGDEEKKQVNEVLNSGNLSTFIASTGKNFLRGEKLIMIPVCRHPTSISDIDDVINSIHKILKNKDELS